MKKLAIFDLDGTLLNTIADLGNAVNYALGEMGYPPHPLRAYNHMVGNGVRRLIERASPDSEPEKLETLLQIFLGYYFEHCTDNTRPYTGIPELLKNLHEQGVAIAVASNKFQAAVDKIIPYYFPDVPFVSIKGQIEERPTKPDPSVIFSILHDHPTPKNEVLMIGDSAVDMETARRACVESIGVTWGFRPTSELRNAYANHIISKPEEVLQHLTDPF